MDSHTTAHNEGSSRRSVKARIGLIGTGWWATYAHLPALTARADVDVVALVNPEMDKVRTAAGMFNVPNAYGTYGEMFERHALDGVVVSASHAAHFEAVRAALEHGCHVLAEKPLTLSAAEARLLIEIAKQRNREIVMSCPWNLTPHAQRARASVLAGEIGDVQFACSLFSSWAYETYRGDPTTLHRLFGDLHKGTIIQPRIDANTDPNAGGGQAWCQVSHSAALLFGVTGLTARKVSAYMDRLDVRVDVVDAMSMRLSNGALGVLGSTGNVVPMGSPGQHVLSIYGSRGHLVLDVVDGTLSITTVDGATVTLPQLPADQRYPKDAPANNFVDVILNNAPNLVPGSVGCSVVEFIEAAHESAVDEGYPTTAKASRQLGNVEKERHVDRV